MINIKESDLNLLAYLYSHNREPATRIAKALKLTREQVDYKIKKFEEEKIIKGYIPIVDYSKLGYNLITTLLIKFNKPSKISEFKQKYKSDQHRISYGELLAEYDLFMMLIFKDEKERSEYLSSFFQENNELISNYLILEPNYTKLYPLKFLNNKLKNNWIMIDSKKEQIKIDEKDKKILKLLSKNARAKLTDLAIKTNSSAEATLYRIRRLQKEKLLLGSRAYFDMQKLGYFYTLLFIDINNSKEANRKLKHFAENSPHVESVSFFLQKPTCYMQIFYKSKEEFRETIQSFKNTFKEESFNMKIIPLLNEGEDINTLPFL
jgi:DNA-binding Lrp family transcriptional regulator